MSKTDLSVFIGRNRDGWLAITDKEGCWVGDALGVVCYRDVELAKAALTILWQRSGGGPLRFRLDFFHADELRKKDEVVLAKPTAVAVADYEAKAPKPEIGSAIQACREYLSEVLCFWQKTHDQEDYCVNELQLALVQLTVVATECLPALQEYHHQKGSHVPTTDQPV